MISLRVLFFVILAVRRFDYLRADYQSPLKFTYKTGDTLDVNLTLWNLPPEVNSYDLYYQTENCDKYKTRDSQKVQCDVPAKSGAIPTDLLININPKLDKTSLRVYIQLRKPTSKLCTTKIIFDGVRDEAGSEYFGFNKICLNNYVRHCNITVNFENKCDETLANIICEEPFDGSVRCASPNDFVVPEDTVHQWYQGYNDYSLIGAIPPVMGNKTVFIIKPQKFDNNTEIFSIMGSKHWDNNLTTEKKMISIRTTGYKEDDARKTYSELKQVDFTCQNKGSTQIGLIDPTGNSIITRNITTSSWNFTKRDNNSKLCCLHYNIYKNDGTVFIERAVEDITIFIYEEPLESDQSTTTEKNMANKQESDKTMDKTKYYIGIASVAGIVILILIMYVLFKRHRRKSSDASTNVVLYADLDLRPGAAQRPLHTDDTTYAEIIGVLKPIDGNIKKS